MKDYYAYYKTPRGYHPRSLNSNGGWNVIGCESFVNQPILQYSNEIRSAVLLIHGEADRFVPVEMTMENYAACAAPKELLIVPDAGHAMSYVTAREEYESAVKKFWQAHDQAPAGRQSRY